MFGSFSPESLEKFYDSFEFEECGNGEKMVFGVCRKTGQSSGEKDFDSSSKTEQEKGIEEAAKKAGSDAKNNKPFIDPKTGKKMGWAIKDGKQVAVEWGSVSGEKKVGEGKKEEKTKNRKPKSRKAEMAQTAADAFVKGQESLLQDSRLNDAAKAAIQENIEKFRAKAGL